MDTSEGAGTGLRRRPLLFVADLDRPRLDPDDLHHFDRVLRLKPGQLVTLGDGSGRWREARFGPEPDPVGPVAEVSPPGPAITVAFVPVKGDSPEGLVQKLTELGVDEIVPVLSARSVVRWDRNRAARQHERMNRVAREACLQCRRLTLPRVAHLTSLVAFLDQCQADGEVPVLADPSGTVLGPGPRIIVIGPEGGFDDDELALAPAVRLPGHILRAETAAVVAATVACGLRAGLLGPR
jgi:16S rRNA (uracil1498-N3)-methyltransferase